MSAFLIAQSGYEQMIDAPHAVGNQQTDGQCQTTSLIDNPALTMLASLLPIKDLRFEHRNSNAPEFAAEPYQDGLVERIARTVFRTKKRHVLLVGANGVGKTTVLRKFAAKVCESQYPFLSSHSILYADLANVGLEDSRACAETLFSAVPQKTSLLLCLDGLVGILKRPNGGSNKPLVRALLARPSITLIGTMAHWDYVENILADHLMQALFVRLDLREPNANSAKQIVRHTAATMQSRFGVEVPASVADRTVDLTSTFLLGECQPAKSVDVLHQVCEDLLYDQPLSQVQPARVTVKNVVKAIAHTTGIAEETITGQGKALDFANVLKGAVVGQDAAIREVAEELQLISAGLTDSDKPASVMMFAGLTGVGKTELAKRIAELYSTSGRLQIYSMGNFTEAHSVSGLIGVPPGYVGHEEGGRLINDLVADPYSVFLFDEAEKCHPNVWKPFLNLFDEGWIVDQRGKKAYADRAIFILTTNAGDRSISQLARSGASAAAISEHVRKTLSRVRQERSSQPVFPPQFLSRIKRIIVFNPLSDEAMVGIADRSIARMKQRWLRDRQKEVCIPADVVKYIGTLAAKANAAGEGQEGGRIVKKLLSEKIEHPILLQSLCSPEGYAKSERILVSLGEQIDSADPSCEVTVTFC